MKPILIFSIALLSLIGCSPSGGNKDEEGQAPAAAALSAPANNSECLNATSVSETESKVTFQWQASENTDTYVLMVKNLNNQTTLQYNAGGNTALDVTLLKGTAYSWTVTSKSNSASQPAVSEKWKFYNAGTGVTNYVPFPAEAVAPPMSSTVSGPTVTLQWSGSDVDNDISSYKVLLDTNTNPATVIGTTSANNLSGIAVASGSTYYWKVITTDSAGNSSDSAVFQFKTH